MKILKLSYVIILFAVFLLCAYLLINNSDLKIQNERMILFIGKLKREHAEYRNKTQKYILQDEAARTRQLNFNKPVDYVYINKDEVKFMIFKKAEDELSRATENTDDYEKVLTLFGFLEEGDHIMPYIESVYSEQVQGMYDDEKNEMILVDGLPLTGSLQRMFMVHEFVHVLQDQNYGLKNIPIKDDNEDRALAALSLVEGDASLTMMLYYKKHFKIQQLLWDIVSYLSIDQSQIFASPQFIRDNLLFPYKQGLKFVMFFYEQGLWDRINELYTNPPSSSEQILHPDKYGVDFPIEVTVKDNMGEGWIELDRNTMGEANIRILLSMFLGEYDSIDTSAGWGGDQWVVWENPEYGKCRLVWETTWDTDNDAEEFYNAIKKYIRKRKIEKGRIFKKGRNVKIVF